MPATKPANRSQSWSAGASYGSTPPRYPRLSRLVGRIGWIELTFTVLALFAYDLCAVIIVGLSAHAARCPRLNCSMATQLQISHDSYWLVPLTLALPLLVGLIVRKFRIMIALLQVAVCMFLLVHVIASARLTDDRLHGRVPCWNPSYSAAECPWA
ncbi:MAG: hypothetical protein ABI140_03405, partial [Jatrophihabitantaceae bacterium]